MQNLQIQNIKQRRSMRCLGKAYCYRIARRLESVCNLNSLPEVH